jgi:nucleotide-binding universal stress UspA family protein
MVQTILIPLDGSPLAELALPYAEALAKKTGARVHLVQAAWAERPVDEHWGEHQADLAHEAQDYLAGASARLQAAGLQVSTSVPYGGAAEVILDQAAAESCDVIIMATHGRSGMGRWVYGSVAESVLARSPVPVLLVRAGQAAEPVFDCPRVIVSLDGSEFSEAALPVAQTLARRLGAELVLVRVVPAPEHAIFDEQGRMVASIDQEAERLKYEGQDYLREVASRLATNGLTIRQEVRVGDAATSIVAASQEGCAALVIMATHGRTGLGRLILGSVAGAVLRQGNVPLLLVRPGQLEEQREPERGVVEAPAARAVGDVEPLGQGLDPGSLMPEALLIEGPRPAPEDWSAPGRSPVERLLDTIEAHTNAESASLRAYHDLAERTPDPLARLLMGMVLADEERHHTLLQRMAISLRDDINWTHSSGALPIEPPAGQVAMDVIEATRERIREEQEGVRHARELARGQRGLYDGLFELLLQVMAADSEKHERILRFVLKRLEAAETAPEPAGSKKGVS